MRRRTARKIICRILGHDPVFSRIELPRRTWCRSCGKQLSPPA